MLQIRSAKRDELKKSIENLSCDPVTSIVVFNGYELYKINEKMEQMQIKQDQKDTKLEQQFMDLLITIEDLKANRSPSSERPS